MKFRNYQEAAIDSIFDYFDSGKTGNPIIASPTGCHAKGHGILMYTGEVKKVEDVVLGDRLMGPDSMPRTVLELKRGRQVMRKIIPEEGESFVVNLDHILNVQVVRRNVVENVSIREYEESTDQFRHIRKLRRVGVSFPTKNLLVDPYFLGLMVGGSTSADENIPLSYKTGDFYQRSAVLAGIWDNSGHIEQNAKAKYNTVSKQLATDLLFLIRSLGLCGTVELDMKTGAFWKVHLSGNFSFLPFKKDCHKAAKWHCNGSPLYTGFTVEKLPEDDYFGFTLDSDHLYLDEFFNVHHNTGKSIIIGGFIQKALQTFPGTRVMKLTHSKELIEQNAEKLLALWPQAPVGVYSAGLKRKELGYPVIFGGIGTIARATPELFGKIDLLLVDECHMISNSESTMYQSVIKGLKGINPYLKTVGFTATPYRLGQGMLTDPGGLFTDVCFDLTTLKSFNWLLQEGYLSPLIPKKTDIEFDLSGVHIQGGEYKQNELQAAVDQDSITYAAVQEMLVHGHDRHHWLVFASGIEHAIHVAAMLDSLGVSSTFVHSKMSDGDRDASIVGFKQGKYRAMVNNGVLTTGFDFPGIDLIGMLRPTQSPSLWVQMLGRGTRPVYAEGFDLDTTYGRLLAMQQGPKQNCLVLDFAGNTRRLGPINDPVLPKKKGSGGNGVAPVRLCDSCGTYIHASLTSCPHCGHEFPRSVKINHHAGTEALIATEEIKTEVFKVDRVTYAEHRKEGKPPSIKVSYFCGLRLFKEYVCLEHGGFPARRAREWWRERALGDLPSDTEEALQCLDILKEPIQIRVWLKPQYSEILAYDFVGDMK